MTGMTGMTGLVADGVHCLTKSWKARGQKKHSASRALVRDHDRKRQKE